MGIEFLIARDSPPDEIDKAYNAASFAYRTIVFDYVRRKRIDSISALAEKAGCEYPDIVEKFIRGGQSIPSGKDIDRLFDAVDGKGKWLSSMKNLQIHASLGNAKPMTYEDRPQLSKETDLAIREAINKLDWFYLESSNRFLKQNLPESGNP